MVVLDSTSKTISSLSPLSLSAAKDKPKVSFSDLLKIVSSKKGDDTIQNGSFVLELGSEEKTLKSTKSVTKSDVVAALLKGVDKASVVTNDEPMLLNPKLVATLSKDEMKSLIADAKNFLKTKVEESDDFKKSQIKELPKTLKGLIEVAQKFNIDISKVTVEDVKAISKGEFSQELLGKLDVKEAPQIHTKEEKERQSIFDTIVSKSQENPLKEIKTVPLFTKETPAEQLVYSKVSSSLQAEHKTTKDRSDETLKLLLRGEKPSQSDLVLTDFSTVAAKVLAPKSSPSTSGALEKLLSGESETKSETTTQTKLETDSKVEPALPLKNDSLEVKINEAKQMIKYLSGDIKSAIDDYKSPFTRVKVQLNPQNLGEMDLTVVQRGKNLHVNLSSNNAAINALAMNINELKMQLNNSGIDSATINFNTQMDGQNGSNSGKGQQRNQQEQKAQEQYDYFANENKNEEILSSLEIVVPRYI